MLLNTHAPEIVRGSSPGGAWSYIRWTPASLAPFVDHLWAFEGPTAHTLKRVFSTGTLELIVNLAEPYALLRPEGSERQPTVSLSGPTLRPLLIRQPSWQRCVAARLRPAGAYALLKQPLSEVAGLAVDLDDLLGDDARALADGCAQAADALERLQTLASWLQRRLVGARRLRPAIAWALTELDRSAGACAIADLREHTGLSKARLAAAFREGVGLTPKRYARVVRFRRVLAALQTQDEPSLTALAHDAHFYDQPHMNAEFRTLGGLTPREFLASRHPVGDGATASAIES